MLTQNNSLILENRLVTLNLNKISVSSPNQEWVVKIMTFQLFESVDKDKLTQHVKANNLLETS